MKVLLCGGGTAGHVTPAVAIAEAILNSHRDTKLLFVGREGGFENGEITKKGYPLKTIEISGFKRKIGIENFKSAYKLLKSMKRAKEILREFMPDVVIGTGGYVCFPVLKMAERMKIPTVLHESNSTPGLSSRLLSAKCDRVLLNFQNTEGEYKEKRNIKVVGNPIREDFFKLSKSEARKRLNIKNDEIMILSVGGSGGAYALNQISLELMAKYSEKTKPVRHVHVSGKKYFETISERRKEEAKKGGCEILPYIENMPLYLLGADIVISRCGAMTLSELSATAKAAILIPSPNVANNHQYKNALIFKEADAAIIIEEKDLTLERLKESVSEICKNKKKRSTLEKNIRQFYVRNAKERIVEEIESVVRGRK